MKNYKTILLSAVVLSTVGIVTSVTNNEVHADTPTVAIPTGGITGTFGSSNWKIYEDGKLVIDPGTLGDANGNAPWKPYQDEIKTIQINKDVVAGPNSCKGLFAGLTKVTQIVGLPNLDTSKAVDMSYMFYDMRAVTALDVSGFNTSEVTDMSYMFFATSISNLDLGSFNTSKVTNMKEMFTNLRFEQLKLGAKTRLSSDSKLGVLSTPADTYTGKWQTLGTGSEIYPNGDWSGTTDELITRSGNGKADTYVAQRVHDYVFTANDITVKQSEVSNLDLLSASKVSVKDNKYPSENFTVEVKDRGGLTNKVGTYKVVLGVKSLPAVTKTINVKVEADPTPTPRVTYQTLYRLYNKNTGEHLYTTSSFERSNLIKAGWNNEGVGWSAPNKGTAVYRVYNPNAKGGDHYYTASKYEAESLVKSGWKWDNNGKAIFYSSGKTPVYVAYNPNAQSGSHNYTTNTFEQNSLLNNGWKFGKVQFYGK